MVRPSHPCAPPPLRGEHQHPTPSRRAERAACRRYAIMVSPTQSVPEVLAVWGSDYKKAIVCRRYTIMVAQPHHNPHNPHTSQTSTTPTPPPRLTTHKKNEQQARRLNCSFPLSTAVRTRLELATPCVTGMYSNQLNYRTSLGSASRLSSVLRVQSYYFFSIPANFLAKNSSLT